MRHPDRLLMRFAARCGTAAALLSLAAAGRADEFFQMRDENPLVRGFYLPLPSDERQDAGGQLSATLIMSNTLNAEQDGPQSMLVDGESEVLNLSYENALSTSWRYRVSLPIVYDSGGILDPVIDDWHQLLGLPQGDRREYPRNKFVYFYKDGNVDIDMNQSGLGIGDLAAELGWYAVDDAHRTLSWWGGVQAPTGAVSRLTSDGAWDGASWVHGAVRWPQWRVGVELGVTQPFGDELFGGQAHKTSEFARVAVTRQLGQAWSLRVQFDGQTARLHDNEIRFLGPSLQMSVGAERRLHGGRRLEFGFAEDLARNTAPDIAFFIGIRG
jgi:hypothetical protein